MVSSSCISTRSLSLPAGASVAFKGPNPSEGPLHLDTAARGNQALKQPPDKRVIADCVQSENEHDINHQLLSDNN